MVGECEWCRQEQAQGSAHAQGSAQPSEGVRDIAGVGKRPVSERHMPIANLVSEASKRGEQEEATQQNKAEKGFSLGEVRKKLAVVRAAEVRRVQHEGGNSFDLQRAQRNLRKLRAEEAARQPQLEAAAAPAWHRLRTRNKRAAIWVPRQSVHPAIRPGCP